MKTKCNLCGYHKPDEPLLDNGICRECSDVLTQHPNWSERIMTYIGSLRNALDGVHIVVRDHENKQRLSHCADTPAQTVRGVLNEYEDSAVRALQLAKEFRDRMMVDVRAWDLVLHMVMNASTHKEKDARLRGCIELMNHAIDKLNREQFDIALCHRPSFKDCIESDYPTRHFVERIHELERQIEELKNPKDQQANENKR